MKHFKAQFLGLGGETDIREEFEGTSKELKKFLGECDQYLDRNLKGFKTKTIAAGGRRTYELLPRMHSPVLVIFRSS